MLLPAAVFLLLALASAEGQCYIGYARYGFDVVCNGATENDVKSLSGSLVNAIYLENSKFSTITRDLFRNFPNLKHFTARKDNKIQRLDSDCFKGLPELIIADVSNNEITEIDANLLSQNSKVESLFMSKNTQLVIPTNNPLLISSSLILLDISSCSIRELNNETFHNLPSLQYLILKWNVLSSLPPDIFKNNRLLQTISINGNKFSTLQPAIFEGLPIASVQLEDNPWNCDCSLSPLVLWARERKQETINITCAIPTGKKWMEIEDPPKCKKILNLCKVLYPGDDDANC